MSRISNPFNRDLYRDDRFQLILLLCVGAVTLFLLTVSLFTGRIEYGEAEISGKTPEPFLRYAEDSLDVLSVSGLTGGDLQEIWTVTMNRPSDKDAGPDLQRIIRFYRGRIHISDYDSSGRPQILQIRDSAGRTTGEIRMEAPVELEPCAGEIALIIDDFGYGFGNVERGYLDLNPRLTFSVIPGHKYSEKIARLAVRRGHGVMIHMPMEPLKYRGGEENFIIMDGMERDEIRRRIARAMKQIPQAKGMNNHMGSRITSSRDMMKKIAGILREKRLFIVDSYTASGSVVKEIQNEYRLPVLQRDIFLDHVNEEKAILGQIEKMRRIAGRKGQVIAIAHDRELTYRILKEELPKIEAAGYRFVYVGDLIK